MLCGGSFISNRKYVLSNPTDLVVLLIVSERYGNDRKFLFYKHLQQHKQYGTVTSTGIYAEKE
jgi:hypothetical protein